MRCLTIIALLMTVVSGLSQQAGFSVQVGKEEILVGEQTEITLEIASASSDTISMPVFNDTLVSAIEILNRNKIDTEYVGGNLERRILKQTIIVTSFDSGYYAIAPLKATINKDTILSNPFLISVKPVPIDTAKGIYDIRGVAQAPFSIVEWLKENWQSIIAIILFLLVILAAYLWWKNKPVAVPEIVKEPTRPAHEIALEKIHSLRAKKLWQSGKVKVFYSELTYILREYIELRFDIPALEQTTDEIVQSMKMRHDFSPEIIEETKQVLFISDLVKFAKENPVGSENEKNLDRIEEFIQGSKLESNNTQTNA